MISQNESEFRAEFSEVNEKTMRRYVEKYNLDTKCNRCGAEAWAISPTMGWVVLTAWFPATSEMKQNPATCLICDNCGNMWMISLRKLVEVQQEMRKEGSGDA